MIAFVSCVAEHVGDERASSTWVSPPRTSGHRYALLLRESGQVIMEDIQELRAALKERAYEFKDLPAMGRSHGVHAEPIAFGLKFALCMRTWAETSTG